MILFQRVKYQNFLASGQVPIDIPLNAHTSTLIIGRNGVGKSTMTEAVCFALFGRALRNITKPSLVNSINKSDALVELWFQIDQTCYQIRRGIKPNLFEIYADGVMIPQPAALADYQTMLEENILGLTYKAFMQIVVLGSASYVPFMRLSPAARREIIEDLLDIQVFSVMSALTKDELSANRVLSEQLMHDRRAIEQQIRMAESFVTQMSETHEQRMANLRTTITSVNATIQELEEKQTAMLVALRSFEDTQVAYSTAAQRVTEYTATHRALQARQKKLDKEREFYETHDECPTCAQPIDVAFKDARVSSIVEKRSTTDLAHDQCVALIEKYADLSKMHKQDLDREAYLRSSLTTVESQLEAARDRVQELTKELSTPTFAPMMSVDLDGLRAQLVANERQHAEVSSRRAVLEAASAILKDNGIKARVIKHYLPIINRQINHYLTAMDFPIHFTFDAEFNETIQSMYREKFSYESFSEGEKKRIDIALLLSWRAVAALKNSASCNMLVLDEVFDSSLDAGGTEEFLKIIHTLERANVFVISHKTDSLVDRFSHILQFVKERGFSSLKA